MNLGRRTDEGVFPYAGDRRFASDGRDARRSIIGHDLGFLHSPAQYLLRLLFNSLAATDEVSVRGGVDFVVFEQAD